MTRGLLALALCAVGLSAFAKEPQGLKVEKVGGGAVEEGVDYVWSSKEGYSVLTINKSGLKVSGAATNEVIALKATDLVLDNASLTVSKEAKDYGIRAYGEVPVTLTLNGVSTLVNGGKSCITSDDGCALTICGDGSVDMTTSAGDSAIFCENDLEIGGSATVVASQTNETERYSAVAVKGDFSVTDHANLFATNSALYAPAVFVGDQTNLAVPSMMTVTSDGSVELYSKNLLAVIATGGLEIGAEAAGVLLQGGATYPATVVGYDLKAGAFAAPTGLGDAALILPEGATMVGSADRSVVDVGSMSSATNGIVNAKALAGTPYDVFCITPYVDASPAMSVRFKLKPKLDKTQKELEKIFDVEHTSTIVEPVCDVEGVILGHKVTLGKGYDPIALSNDFGAVTIDLNGWTIKCTDGAAGSSTTAGGNGGAAITLAGTSGADAGETAITVTNTAPACVQLWANGPYFATCNVGAANPEDYGDLIGFAGAGDEVSSKMGPEWWVPTKTELDALKANCDRQWTDLNGVNGYRMTGKGAYSSKSIFLPAAGYDSGNSSRGLAGTMGCYWSSTQGSSESFPQAITFAASYFMVNGSDRSYLQSVRAVRGSGAALIGGDGGDGNPAGKGAFAVVDATGAAVAVTDPLGLVQKGDDGDLLISLPSGVAGYTYVVSNLTDGAEAEIAPAGTTPGGATYALPIGAKVGIYCVPAAGYEVTGTNPYVIDEVKSNTTIDEAQLPTADPPEMGAVQLWENGPYFATCNVGATAPQDSGIYTNFNGAAQAVTDVMGAGWRVLTKDELQALLDNCNNSWSNNYDNTGIGGLMFTSKSDSSKSIFLPAVSSGAGRYWTSSEKDSDNAWYLYFDEGEISIGANPRVAGAVNVRAVRDTLEPEISAVSAEGWLDLTVGDRIAQDVETLVADPAWGNASEATIKLKDGWTRDYTSATVDTWDTTALTPGRYSLAFRAGELLDNANFWKTGADWVVLDLPPYSTEGIEFQADKTYLALGQYEFAPDKTLTVLDGAKFEYAPGAGFKGGKVEMPRRYGTNVVEGGLFQIVERIKGCADNPWEVGVGVEAYTNGTELVVAGAGMITGLSEIPSAIRTGATAITITEAMVEVALENMFAGFSNIALTLPDNWQGDLPKNNRWYGATNVELTRWPMAVRNVKPQQRYPWNGKVDVDFDLTGEGAVKVTLSARVDGKLLKNPTVDGETTFDLGDGGELKNLKLTWDAGTDFGDAELHQKIKVKLTAEKAEIE